MSTRYEAQALRYPDSVLLMTPAAIPKSLKPLVVSYLPFAILHISMQAESSRPDSPSNQSFSTSALSNFLQLASEDRLATISSAMMAALSLATIQISRPSRRAALKAATRDICREG